jgi:hypothetical protein
MGTGGREGAALPGDVADQYVAVAGRGDPVDVTERRVAPAMTANLSSSSHWKRT